MIHAMHSNPLIPWFQPDSYLQELKRFINNSNGVNWGSCTMHDNVYFKESILWNCAAKLAHDNHHIQQQQEHNDKALKSKIIDAIISALLRADHIAHQYQPDRKYHIITGSGKRNNERLVPVKLKSFGMDTVQAELLKNAFLQDVTDIQKGHFYGHNP